MFLGLPNEIWIDILMIIEGIAFFIGIWFFFKWLFSIKMGNLRFKRNPYIIKKDYKTLEVTKTNAKTGITTTIKRINHNELDYDKQTDIVPTPQNRLVCIILLDSGGIDFIIRNMREKHDYFKYNHGMYIIDREAIHVSKNGTRASVYLEGVSTPLRLSMIEKEIVEVQYRDLYGNSKTSKVQKIKGLKFDSKILDTFANREFAELFTKSPQKNLIFYVLIIGIVTLIASCIGIGVSYYFK